ncbi:OTU domain-containing protein [Spiroplasma ixodetis]
MNNEYINKTFFNRYIEKCFGNHQLLNPTQNETIEDLDIYRQILIDWENTIEEELGFKIIFENGKFKEKLINKYKDEKKEEIRTKYFLKRKEVLKFIFSPIIIKKINNSQTWDLILEEDDLRDFYHYILNINDKRMVLNEEIELIKSINFENSFAIYESIIKNIKKLKYLILPLDLQTDENLKFNRLKTITDCSGPWFNSFEATKKTYGKNNNQTWAELLTEMSDEIINYENKLFKSFEISVDDLNNSKMNQNLKLKNLKNVPKDGNCLFWAIIFAYLEPVKKDQYQLQKRHKNLFGADTEYNFILEKVDFAFWKYIKNKNMLLLFRNKVIDYIQENIKTNRGDNKATFESSVLGSEINNKLNHNININKEEQIRKTLKEMRKDGTWGGSIEIEAICNILNCKISRNEEVFEPDHPIPDFIEIKLHFANNHYQYYLIKQTKKSNINSSISFSIDKILKEEPSNKKIKVEDKSIDFNEKFQFSKIQYNPNPKFLVKDTSDNYLYSELKHQDIISINQNERPSSVSSISTINSNFSTGTFHFTSDERPSSVSTNSTDERPSSVLISSFLSY